MDDLERIRQAGVKVNNLLCFALYAASRSAIDIYRPLLDKIGLTYPQYLVMLLLWEQSPRTIKELGTTLQLDTGTLSPLIKRLEGKKLLKRQRDTEDERVVNIYLTDGGRALKDQAVELGTTLFCQAGLSLEEYVALTNQLHHLTARLAAANKPSFNRENGTLQR